MFSTNIEEEYKTEIDEIYKGYEHKKERRQALVGTIVSTKCEKTIVVRVIHQKFVSKYDHFVNVQRRIMAHDQDCKGQLGDLVRIIPCRPVSKKKRHSLIDIVKRPKQVVTEGGIVLSAGGNVSKR